MHIINSKYQLTMRIWHSKLFMKACKLLLKGRHFLLAVTLLHESNQETIQHGLNLGEY